MPPSNPDPLTTESPAERARRAGRALYERDQAAKSLGIQVNEVTPGGARLTMRVRPDMTNGHEVCHGGLVFSLADTAFAYACNSYGDNTLAAAASIDFLAPSYADDILTATARELWRAGRSGLYEVDVTNQKGERIAIFRGRSHRISGKLIE
jgi:acyl-CoA thioesterase